MESLRGYDDWKTNDGSSKKDDEFQGWFEKHEDDLESEYMERFSEDEPPPSNWYDNFIDWCMFKFEELNEEE